MGHEFAGDIVKVGKAHQDKFKPGMKFTLQPALNYKGTMWSPGYSYEFFGGDATYCIIPAEVMELGCLLEYKGRAYYEASLAEPMSCSIGAFNAAYHTKMGVYHHDMGIKKGGKLAILAGAGPMGLGALTYALHRYQRGSSGPCGVPLPPEGGQGEGRHRPVLRQHRQHGRPRCRAAGADRRYRL